MDPTPGHSPYVGGQVAVIVAAIGIVISVGIIVIVFGITEARAPDRLTVTGGASLDATSRVMDTSDGSPAVPARKVDDPA